VKTRVLHRGDTDWRPFFLLDELIPPGLPDIKWNELYSKWGKFILEEKKKDFKYYLEKPPSTLTKAIAEQSAQAKKARAGRSRGLTVTTTSKPPQKKTARKTSKK
jgi:hypothetical protein